MILNTPGCGYEIQVLVGGGGGGGGNTHTHSKNKRNNWIRSASATTLVQCFVTLKKGKKEWKEDESKQATIICVGPVTGALIPSLTLND